MAGFEGGFRNALPNPAKLRNEPSLRLSDVHASIVR